MRVRPARDEDAEAFGAVIAAVAAEERWIATEGPVDVADRAARTIAWIERGDGIFVLEDDDGRIVGNLGLHRTHAPGVLTLGMSIVAEARGRGGGRALLEAAMTWVQERPELHKVELEVLPDNARAIALYARHGFAVEGLRRDHYRRRDGELRSALIMARLFSRECAT